VTDNPHLLDYAEQVLNGEIALGSSGARTAALLARCALEDWLDAKSAAWLSTTYPFPSARSKLVALEALGDRDVGERAQRVWNALSRNVHHHAYELQPSAAEVWLLVAQVRDLGRSTPR
jgi:hypothetical protein